MSNIKDEFEKAFLEEWKSPDGKFRAMWAAKWMAERCAKVAEDDRPWNGKKSQGTIRISNAIRQLSKELE